jgi:hypothetical protein
MLMPADRAAACYVICCEMPAGPLSFSCTYSHRCFGDKCGDERTARGRMALISGFLGIPNSREFPEFEY